MSRRFCIYARPVSFSGRFSSDSAAAALFLAEFGLGIDGIFGGAVHGVEFFEIEFVGNRFVVFREPVRRIHLRPHGRFVRLAFDPVANLFAPRDLFDVANRLEVRRF